MMYLWVYAPREVRHRLRQAVLLTICVLMAVLFCAGACASEFYETADYTVSLALSGRGLTSTVTFRLDNRSTGRLTLLVRDIALNGECTGYTAEYSAQPGELVRSVSFRREAILPVTVCDAGIAVLAPDGSVLAEETLTVLPYGASSVTRPKLTDFQDATAALDNENASLLILPPSDAEPKKRVLWLFNKSDALLRLRLSRILVDGKLTELSLTVQALPQTGQYAELVLPEPTPDVLTFSMAGYLAGKGEQPVFQDTYEYRLSAPVSVPTMVPANTPLPQIGTVTIRKSGAVNVRESDNTSSKKVGSAKAGMTYPFFGVSPAGWYLIRLDDGTEGYVTNTLTTLQRQ